MNITSFTNQAVLLLQEQFGDSYHVFSRRVTKNNGVTLTGIVARRENPSRPYMLTTITGRI